jgi:hypothetical protein
MPMSLSWVVPNSLSGWVCCCSSKEKKLKNVHSSNDETIKRCDLRNKKHRADSSTKDRTSHLMKEIVDVCNTNKGSVQAFRGTQEL